MRFRPCIDIHNGKVKQIVGGSLQDDKDQAVENFSSQYGSSYYAGLYKRDGLTGGHMILLNSGDSEYNMLNKKMALEALETFPGGLQTGGGITAENAEEYIKAGASHVIVTSYVFREGEILWKNIDKLVQTVGREHVVIDVSCRKKGGDYYIVTDRWQKFTEIKVSNEVLVTLSKYCDEFLVHGVDAEGKRSGMEEELVSMLASYKGRPVTYAGGIGSIEDIERFRLLSGGGLDFTIGSALDLFGGNVPYEVLKNIC